MTTLGQVADDTAFAALAASLRSLTNPMFAEARSIDAAIDAANGDGLDLLVARALGSARLEAERRAVARAMILERDVLRIRRAFDEAGVDALFLKGALSDALWWGGRGMRGGSDIDVLIARDCEPAAARALADLGYIRHVFRTHRATNDASKERLYVASAGHRRFPVDLHVGLINSPPYRDFAVEALSRAQVYETAIGPLRGLCPEDMLVHLAGNLGGGHFVGRMKLALDAACVVARCAPDFIAVAQRARGANVSTPLWALLRIVDERLGVPVPRWFVRDLAPHRAIRWAVERAAGVSGPPVRVRGPGRALLEIEWPLSGRALWPLEATARWARLRIADRIRSTLPV